MKIEASVPLPRVVSGEEPAFSSYVVRDGIAWVMMERPEVANSQNFRLLRQLDDLFRCAVDAPDVKAIVLGGRGKHFSAGHDLGTVERDKHLERDRHQLWYSHLGRDGAEGQYVLEQDAYLGLCRRWQEIPKPMIAMVQGGCIAGGLMLAWVCDLIIASDDAFFQDPVVRMGIPGVEYFAHAFELPPRVARELLLLGERMPVERAYQLGMVNRVVPRADLEQEVERIGRELASRPGFGMLLTKQAINAIEDLRGKRTGMDSVFHMHHLAHAHNQLVSGDRVGGIDVKAMAAANRQS
ncbi:enoyl-CoA hydratase [Sphingosinicella microcystinivorans]|uniref:enoyl-CoA hydratase n=1 Tax=Sphingosinicella microcystinivorans TaxID=335406 RepID=UPI0022F38C46|nr:enoyl-CoA hydratase [Sphingosinicella microcystinivorans]WBX83774.1 enoyl-CoA hydratase [Sphingosinicella microcystinivorans]